VLVYESLELRPKPGQASRMNVHDEDAVLDAVS